MSTPFVRYTANSDLRNPRAIFRDMASGMFQSRYVAYRLAVKDLRSENATTVFGLVWDFLDPLVLAAIFYALMRSRVISTDGLAMPPSVYVVFGLLTYQVFIESLIRSTELMKRHIGLLNQVRVTPEALILSVCYRLGFNATFRMAAILAITLLAGVFHPRAVVVLLAGLPLVILTGVVIGIGLAPLNVLYHDVGRFVRIIAFPLRFATPVVWHISPESRLGKLQPFMPFSPLLDNMREYAVNGTFSSLGIVAVHVAIIPVLGLVAWFFFHVSMPLLADRS